VKRDLTEPEASAELTEAAMWYERKREGLGLEFLEVVVIRHSTSSSVFHKPDRRCLSCQRTYTFAEFLYNDSVLLVLLVFPPLVTERLPDA